MTKCNRCSRLRKYCRDIATIKRRAYRNEEYWGKPVPGFGDPSAQLWIVGLAPAAHGANRTGRVFTGDRSGQWLYRVLHQVGWSSREASLSRGDDLQLLNVYISAVARCAPPENMPSTSEILRCSSFLDRELELLKNLKLIVVLGRVAFHSVTSLCKRNGLAMAKQRDFGHGSLVGGHIPILCSYHPSQQNTQTGRLTWPMWLSVFEKAKRLIVGRANLDSVVSNVRDRV